MTDARKYLYLSDSLSHVKLILSCLEMGWTEEPCCKYNPWVVLKFVCPKSFCANLQTLYICDLFCSSGRLADLEAEGPMEEIMINHQIMGWWRICGCNILVRRNWQPTRRIQSLLQVCMRLGPSPCKDGVLCSWVWWGTDPWRANRVLPLATFL